tara:strand:- start:380 stop:568 length:189 start_codon:yes stop_codon:yes gene_type:complete
MEGIYRNAFEKGEELSSKNYKEKRASFALSKCNAVLINHSTKKFWYTIKEDAQFIISLINSN